MATRATSTGKRFDSLEQEAFLGLWRTYDRLRALEDELFAGYDLTPQQYNALRLLARRPPGHASARSTSPPASSRAPRTSPACSTSWSERGLIDARPPGRQPPRRPRRHHRRRHRPAGRTCTSRSATCHARQLGHLTRASLADLIALLRAARLPHEDADSSWR